MKKLVFGDEFAADGTTLMRNAAHMGVRCMIIFRGSFCPRSVCGVLNRDCYICYITAVL